MALIHADSFSWLTAAQLTRAYSTVDDGSGSILVGPYGRGTGDAIRFSGDAAAYIRRSSLTTSGSVAIVEADVRISSAPGAATALFRVLVGTTVQASLAVETDRKLKAYRGDLTTGLGSASSYVVPVDTWVRICLKLTINDATGAVLVYVWEPGDTSPQTALNLTSQDTKAHASSALWDAFDVSAACSGTTDVTGLVVTDGSGSKNNDLVSAKPRTVEARRPNGVGASSGFTPSSGLTNYVLVDDQSPDDDSSLVSTVSANVTDTYEVEDASDASQTIHGVVAALVGKKGGPTTFGHVIRYSGSNTVSAAVSMSSSYTAHLYPYDEIPGSISFTAALFANLQFGFKSLIVSGGTPALVVSTSKDGDLSTAIDTDPIDTTGATLLVVVVAFVTTAAVTAVPTPAPTMPAPGSAAQASASVPTATAARNDHFTIKRILPISGPIRYGEWHWDETGAPATGPLVMTVDLEARVLSVFRGGYEIGATAVLLGTQEKPTPLGKFPVIWKKADHYSRTYDGAPMPFTHRLTNDGIAIHGTKVEKGYASHGCIGVPNAFGKKLFAVTKLGDVVYITRGKRIGLGDSLTGG